MSALIRRAYLLPEDLLDRVRSFQHERRFGSEAKAVRALLDEALSKTETGPQLQERAKQVVARGVGDVGRMLFGHPMLKSLEGADGEAIADAKVLRVLCRDGHKFTISRSRP